HDVRDFVTGVGPNVDDLVVTLAVGDDAFAILLFDGANLFVSVFELGRLLFRNDHVRNPDRDTGLGSFGETELLQTVERFECALRTGDLIAAPDNVAQLFFASRLVKESELFGPDLIK